MTIIPVERNDHHLTEQSGHLYLHVFLKQVRRLDVEGENDGQNLNRVISVCIEREPARLHRCAMQLEFRFDLLQFSMARVHEMSLTHESTHE